MVLLIAFLHVMPPMTLGRPAPPRKFLVAAFKIARNASRERIKWERPVDEAVRRDFTIVCIGPDMQVERKRFEFRTFYLAKRAQTGARFSSAGCCLGLRLCHHAAE